MATGIWDVKRDGERLRWMLEPFVYVGPLRFGMHPAEVAAVLGQGTADYSKSIPWGDTVTVQEGFTKVGLTAYYADEARLAGITVDARLGPQVLADGTALVGRKPSEVEQWLIERAEAREPYSELFYMPGADPGSQTLGLVMCVQRAGDVVLTRPVFVASEWIDDVYHRLPASEWSTF
ncbi:hypothetical protein ACFV29_05745 [Streptomyces sp. NPDC059690]|uniref:hypothetical protein n=1 Tax=Streptomyces sp. NPDC059690 TaxID=3346907 RepID=UPI00367DC830